MRAFEIHPIHVRSGRFTGDQVKCNRGKDVDTINWNRGIELPQNCSVNGKNFTPQYLMNYREVRTKRENELASLRD